MPTIEKTIERKFCDEVERRWPEAFTRKMNGSGFRGWPDRMVLLPGGAVVFFEFKQPGKGPEPLQYYMMDRIRKLTFPVYHVDSWQEAIRICEKAIGAAARSVGSSLRRLI